MNNHLLSPVLLLVAICLLVEGANAQIEIPEPGNETFRALEHLINAASANQLSLDPGSNNQLSQMAPEQIWKMAEEGLLLHDGFPTMRQFVTLESLTEIIAKHPKKSYFVEPMLSKIKTTSFPRREPKDWNEIAIFGRGGTAGLLISSVAEIAEPSDCQRIVEAVLATNDPAKIGKLREAASLVSSKDEFEKFLKLYDQRAEHKRPEQSNLNSILPPFGGVGDSAIAALPPKKAPEAKLLALTPSEELPLSTPRSIIVVLIVAAGGLLWLLLKRRG